MEKRVRSPNYPAFGLPDAIEKLDGLHRELHTHAASREAVAKAMGYSSLNGASATAISALFKYGLLAGRGDEVKVSERAMRILHPHSSDEKAEALHEAARQPPLFAELAERFPPPLPNDDVLRNYLIRRGFGPNAVSSVIASYRDTSEFASRFAGPHAPQREGTLEEDTMDRATAAPDATRTPMPSQAAALTRLREDERSLGRYDFEGGSYVRILAAGELDTEEALDMIETLVNLKRKEIERRRRVPSNVLSHGDSETSHESETERYA